jgi:hypothetical protein
MLSRAFSAAARDGAGSIKMSHEVYDPVQFFFRLRLSVSAAAETWLVGSSSLALSIYRTGFLIAVQVRECLDHALIRPESVVLFPFFLVGFKRCPTFFVGMWGFFVG